MRCFIWAVGWLAALTSIAVAQCPPLPRFSVPPADVLSPAQQAQVGRYLIRLNPWPELSAPALLAHVRAVGARLAAQLPAKSGYHFEYHLLAEPYPDAFIMPGGQIFLTRPLLELMRNDSDLAGVLGHEMGHEVTGQLGAELSRMLLAPHPRSRRLPTGASLDRQLNAALTWMEDHPDRLRQQSSGQEAADQVALELTARAGYDPHGLVRVFARLAARQPESGFRLWDWLGLAPPDQRRLDAMANEAAKIRSCAPPAPADLQAFDRWRAAVVVYQPPTRVFLPGLRRIVHLAPALGAAFGQVHFSADGSHLLVIGAQHAWVLRRTPLAVQFRIFLAGVFGGSFAADGRSVVLMTDDGRIEKWSLKSGRRRWTRQEDVAACGAQTVSPGGRWLACALRNGGGLHVAHLPSRALAVATKTKFTSLSFSSDGRYLLAGAHHHWALLDMQTRRWSRWPRARAARFVAPRAVLTCGSHTRHGSCWSLRSAPSGRRIAWLRLGGSERYWRKATRGDAYFTWVRRAQVWVAVSGRTGRVLGISRSGALDGYNGVFAAGAANATVAMVRFTPHGPRSVAKLRLPAAARFRSDTVLAASRGLHWLGGSAGAKTMIWNLSGPAPGILLPVRARSIGFSPGAAWLAVLAKGETTPRRARVDLRQRRFRWLSPPADSSSAGRSRKEPPDGWWLGDTWVSVFPQRGLIMGESAQGQPLWRHRLPRHSTWSFVATFALRGNHIIVTRCVHRQGFLTRLKLNFGFGIPRFVCGAAGQRFTVLRASDGAVIARLTLAHPPWVELPGTQFAGRRLVLADVLHRAMAYDVHTGRLVAVHAGYPIAASAAAHSVVLQNGPRRVDVYSLPAFHRLRTLRFASDTVWAKFSVSGRRLLVVTRNQTAYLFSLAQLASAGRAASTSLSPPSKHLR